MARSLWSGSIAFGLVNIPIKVYTATRDQSIHLHMMSPNGSCRLHQKLYCPDSGKEYDFKETTKAYEISPGKYVMLDRAELEKLKPEKGNAIDIVDFTKADEVDPIYFEKTYYIGPDRRAGKAYKLLFEVMEDTKMVAIGRFVMRSKEYLCLIRPYKNVLCLDTLNYANEIVEIDELPGLGKELKGVKITPKELEMGKRLVEKMATKFDPSQYQDEYKEALEKMIKAKAKGKTIETPEAPHESAKVIDLMDALQKSVARKKDLAPVKRKKPRSSHREAHAS